LDAIGRLAQFLAPARATVEVARLRGERIEIELIAPA
jgi:enamine deaminase RidA (YjgF/YER057c/UK114 family)